MYRKTCCTTHNVGIAVGEGAVLADWLSFIFMKYLCDGKALSCELSYVWRGLVVEKYG